MTPEFRKEGDFSQAGFLTDMAQALRFAQQKDEVQGLFGMLSVPRSLGGFLFPWFVYSIRDQQVAFIT